MMTFRKMKTKMMVAVAVAVAVITVEVQTTSWSQRAVGLCHYVCASDTDIPTNISSDTQCLEAQKTQIRVIRRGAFTGLQKLRKVNIVDNGVLKTVAGLAFSRLPRLADIFISANSALESIGAFAFSDLPELSELTITKSKHLTYIHKDAFKDLVKLQHLIISHTGITAFPDFSKMHSAADYLLLDLHDNSRIQEVPANAFNGVCTQTIRDIRLTRNGIKTVARDAFNDTKMHRLSLKGNRQLSHIHPDAFAGSSELVLLDISQTALSSLPDAILGGLRSLIAESAPGLKELPPRRAFARLREARVTYPSHCCVFRPVNKNSVNFSSKHRMCSLPGAREEAAFFRDHCSGDYDPTCSPAPDDFNPCEDIMSGAPLRALIWVVSVLALLGNAVVLLVLLGSASKLTVPRFLMCHLAFADLCMGVYLLVIAAMDALTRGRYHNHAIDWQTGLGCAAAGFFTVRVRQRAVCVHADGHHAGALAHHHARAASGPQVPAEARLRRDDGRLDLLLPRRDIARAGRQQLQQGEHLPADGRGVGVVSGLRGVAASAQHCCVRVRVRLLPQHLPGGAPPVGRAGPRRRPPGPAHGRAGVHRLPVHGAHLLLRRVGGAQATAHHRVGHQATPGALLPHQLVRQPLPLRLLHARLPPRLRPAGGALRPVQGARPRLPRRQLVVPAAGVGDAQERPRGRVLDGGRETRQMTLRHQLHLHGPVTFDARRGRTRLERLRHRCIN